jgi:hypothetical protein
VGRAERGPCGAWAVRSVGRAERGRCGIARGQAMGWGWPVGEGGLKIRG